MKAYLSGKSFDFDDFEDHEPANMVVALGKNPRDTEEDGTPKWAFFYEFIPCTKIRPKDNRSIVVFNVDLRVRPYVSPMSGGLAYRVKQDKTTRKIQKPEDGCIYPPNLTHEIEWKLFEVHIGEDPEHGPFVGVLMERNITNNLNGNDYEYFQWPGDEECPPLYYGYFPDGWYDTDPRYLEFHSETMRLAQAAARYEMCDSPNCCVRFGCNDIGCKSIINSDSQNLCHFQEECPNANSYYDNMLREWFSAQSEAVESLYEKIPNPIYELVERTILDTFRAFMMEHLEELPKKGDRRKSMMEFWINWAKAKAAGHSDVLFMNSWKIQHAKDEFLKKAIDAAMNADMEWIRYLNTPKPVKNIKDGARKKKRSKKKKCMKGKK
jgi:hypothetical protein